MARKKPLKKRTDSKGRTKKSHKARVKKGWSPWITWTSVQTDQDALLKKVYGFCIGVIFVIMLFLSPSNGINGDERWQVNYSEDLLKFYTSWGVDTSAFNSIGDSRIRWYGGMYEIPAGTINAALGFDQEDPRYHATRRILSAILGFLIIFFVSLVAKELAGWPLAIGVALLMFFSPKFLGHSMINPKDIPFALGYAMFVYYLIKLLQQMPRPPWKILALLTLGMGITIGSRIGGILVVGYLGLFLAAYFIAQHGWKAITTNTKLVGRYALYWAGCSILAYIFGLLFWPYGLVDPIAHTMESFRALSAFPTSIKILFDGNIMWSHEVPYYYLPKLILFSIPLFGIFGLILFFVFLRGILAKYNGFILFILGFLSLFPVFYVIYKGSSLYDGWRHFIFIYGPIVVLAATGWLFTVEKVKHQGKKGLLYGTIAVFSLSVLEPVVFIVRNSAYPYVYFNPILGGIKGAFGNFSTDYWGISTKQAVSWLKKYREEKGETGPFVLAADFSFASRIYGKSLFGDDVEVKYVRPRERYDSEWDYAIFVDRFVPGAQIRTGKWPYERTIHTINANSIPLAAILEKGEPAAWEGQKALQTRNWDQTIEWFSQEVSNHPDNDVAWMGLATAYLSKNDQVNAKNAIDKILTINPEQPQALMNLGLYYINNNNAIDGRKTFERMIEIDERNPNAYYYLAYLDLSLGNHNQAIQHINTCLNLSPQFKQAYTLGAQIYDAIGDKNGAQQLRAAAQRL